MKKLHAITERTDREWPQDHPLREVSSVILDDRIERAEFLICSPAGGERLPAAAGDWDEPCTCSECGIALVRRASSPTQLKPICFGCWDKIE